MALPDRRNVTVAAPFIVDIKLRVSSDNKNITVRLGLPQEIPEWMTHRTVSCRN